VPRNKRIEIRCSSEVKTAFEDMMSELTIKLRKKTQRRVYGEEILKLIVDVYKRNPIIFTELTSGTARIR